MKAITIGIFQDINILEKHAELFLTIPLLFVLPLFLLEKF